MIDRQRAKLEARVRAVNAANARAHEVYKILTAFFAPLVGQAILKNDGDLLAKYAKQLPDLSRTNNLMVYRNRTNYSLAWNVKACENVEGAGNCTYYETGVYIGELQGNVLTKLSSPLEARSDYNADTVQALREDYKKLQAAADNAKGKLFPFDEYDR